ncbi:HTH-type transcriptional activator Btr [compost metagenome]
MREHIFFPKPVFPRHVCYPDFVGGYSEYPEHSVNRVYRTTENNLDQRYNLHFVLSGKGYLDTDNRTYELTRGQGFLYGPGMRQIYRSDLHDPWDIRWVHFYGIHLEELLDGKGLDEPWLFGVADISPFETLVETMLQLGRNFEVDNEFAVASTLYGLLTRLQSGAARLNEPVNIAADKIRAAANFVRARCNEPVNLQQAASIAGYSTHYFSRMFNVIFGMSFSDFLLECRMLKAKQLLASTGLSVKQIALETGFSQTSYFSRCFRSLEGMTPIEFRSIHKS